jgi:hypothetical protein
VDAFTMLGSGRIDGKNDEEDNSVAEEDQWKEIVHHDVHLMNVFVRTTTDIEDKEIMIDDIHRYMEFGKSQVKRTRHSTCS